MADYNCGSRIVMGLDTRTKYKTVAGNKINIYDNARTGGFFEPWLIFSKWEYSHSFEVTSNTKVVRFQPEKDDSGVIRLSNGEHQSDSCEFWIYDKFESFVMELKLFGLQLDKD